MRFLYIIIMCWISTQVMSAPGYLLLIGGGGEKFTANSWEREPYQWAVNSSANKRVAIISFYEQSRALPDFFEKELGAERAQNFLINSRMIADAPETYDTLRSYDVIFLKGGDQYNYYTHYRGTRTETAIMEVYEQGGVICGTSAGLAVMGGVDYVAAEGSADPMEALMDPFNEDITLENDFLPLLPGILPDTHFAERGRFGRLISFMAHWQWVHQESLLGIGVDDMTALAVEPSLRATAYGTGAVNIYRTNSPDMFQPADGQLAADSILVTQILHHCSIDLRTGEISGLSPVQETVPSGETGNYTLLLSGGDAIGDNELMLHDLVHNTGSPEDPILILTRSIPEKALDFQDAMIQLGAGEVKIASATLASAGDETLEETISQARKIIFVDLNFPELKAFMENGAAGEALSSRIRDNGMVAAFVGDMSRMAGMKVAEHYLEEGSSYAGKLEFSEGLGLLSTSMVMPNTYLSSELYENTATAIPYGMVTQHLTYGIWLSPGNYLKYAPHDGKPFFQAFGSPPVMVMKNASSFMGISDQTSYGDGKDLPRQVAGFDQMLLTVLDPGKPYPAGNGVHMTGVESGQPSRQLFTCFPNPASDRLSIQLEKRMTPYIVDLRGRLVWKGSPQSGTIQIPLDQFTNGTYILSLIPLHVPERYCTAFEILKQ